MVFDAIVAEEGLAADLDRLTGARRLELLAAAETMWEIGRTRDRRHRRRLQQVRVLVVPPAATRQPETRRLLTALETSAGVSGTDARIGVAAAYHRVPLATEDRALRAAMAEHLGDVPVWRWEDELRPRLLALSAGSADARTAREPVDAARDAR
jgi:hypothetical protein